jgi:amino acid transporter
LFSISEERILKVKKVHLTPIESYENGANVNFAFSIMVWTLTCLILTIEILIFKTLEDYEFENGISILFSIAVLLSIVLNYLVLWKYDRYETYFKKFKREKRVQKGWIFPMTYHLAITIICFAMATHA